jgi:tetratricopeptide (TPR) repeat protein
MRRITPFLPVFIIYFSFIDEPSLQAKHVADKIVLPQIIRTKSPQAQAEADSLKKCLQLTTQGAGKIDLYGQLCYIYASTIGDVVLAHHYADSIKLLAEELKNESYLSKSDYYFGIVARHESRYADALQYLEKHIRYCQMSGDSTQLANSLYQIAVVHMYQGNYEKSIGIYYQAIGLYEKKENKYGLAISYMGLGNLLTHMHRYDDAIKTYGISLALLNGLRADLYVKMNKLRVLINMGNAYAALKQYTKARLFYSQSLPISNVLGSRRTESTALSSIGDVLNSLQQHDSALVYHLKALSIREQTRQKEKIILSLIQVGETYLLLKDYPTARYYLMKSLSMSKEFQAKPCIRDAYEKLSVLYSLQGNFQKAYQYHRLFTGIKDSMYNEENARQINELQTKYETEKKDKQIALLAKEKEVQQKEVQRQATLKKASISGLFLLGLLIGLLVYIFRQKLKNQQLLAAKDTQIKEVTYKRQMSELEMKALQAQINPHFLFNCMNSINRMILEGDNDHASLYLGKFSKLVRLILENAENAKVTLQNELALLESYIQLESLRFKGKIDYRITVDESIDPDDTYLPSMILQPFVENAIWHGLLHKPVESQQGIIEISVKEENNRLYCIIEDNGIGREKARELREQSVLKTKSLGMKITEERLRLLSKEQMAQLVCITDLKDAFNQALGTRVEINIPVS